MTFTYFIQSPPNRLMGLDRDVAEWVDQKLQHHRGQNRAITSLFRGVPVRLVSNIEGNFFPFYIKVNPIELKTCSENLHPERHVPRHFRREQKVRPLPSYNLLKREHPQSRGVKTHNSPWANFTALSNCSSKRDKIRTQEGYRLTVNTETNSRTQS